MPPRTCGAACGQGDRRARAAVKYFKASVIIAVGYSGTEISLSVAMSRCNEEYLAWLCSVQRGGALTHKHFEMVTFKWSWEESSQACLSQIRSKLLLGVITILLPSVLC